MESKKEIYDLIPKKYYPKTLFFNAYESLDKVIVKVAKSNIRYPFIIKPDVGLQGLRVEKISGKEELKEYLKRVDHDFLIQELVRYPLEIGLFYYRMPNETNGQITGIVFKDFLIIKGNGKNTVKELLLQIPRFAMQLKTLTKKYGSRLEEILPNGASLNLMPYGNHARGSKFTDVSFWINDNLTKSIDEVCKQIPEFYFGRLDIMFQSREDLEDGKNFSIIELNGSGSEPTHIYDPKHSIFFAWREIIRHYDILFKICAYNHQKGHAYLNIKKSRQLIADNKMLKKNLELISQ